MTDDELLEAVGGAGTIVTGRTRTPPLTAVNGRHDECGGYALFNGNWRQYLS
jgi:hypothetical protein